jgi:hypothetical protein
MDVDAIKSQIAEAYRDKKWILTLDAAAGATRMVERMRDQGASEIMIVAALEGVGEVPTVDRIHYTRASGDSIMQGVRAYVHSIDDPSDSLLRAVDQFDPEGTALVLNPGFSRSMTLFGRASYGSRKPQWRDLEDKMIVDELWDAAGVNRAPSAIVAMAEAPAASEKLQSDLGTVWAGDNKEGWHGGGEYVRWVRDANDQANAFEWFSKHADRVRVMPFLDGLPCSIHGIVTGNGVAVFNPVELTILRHVDRAALYYAQGANFWNPPDAVRDEMRSAARSVGDLLADRYGYFGAFGIDGICTKDGFRPTELNPRISLGHAVHALAAEIPIGGIERGLIAGDLAIDATDLETTVLDAAQSKRRGGAMFHLDGSYPAARTGFRIVDDVAVTAEVEESNDGTMELGEAAFGSAIFAQFDSDGTPIGPSIAPRAVAILNLARDLWNVQAPDLEAAPDLCT